jgi:hypothetical protein
VIKLGPERTCEHQLVASINWWSVPRAPSAPPVTKPATSRARRIVQQVVTSVNPTPQTRRTALTAVARALEFRADHSTRTDHIDALTPHHCLNGYCVGFAFGPELSNRKKGTGYPMPPRLVPSPRYFANLLSRAGSLYALKHAFDEPKPKRAAAPFNFAT